MYHLRIGYILFLKRNIFNSYVKNTIQKKHFMKKILAHLQIYLTELSKYIIEVG